MAKFSLAKRLFAIWLDLPLRYRGALIAVIPAVCLVTTLGTWTLTRDRAAAANQWVDHTRTVIAESDRLLVTVLDAETAVRGYTIAADSEFLKPYQLAQSDFPKASRRLSQLVADNPKQTQRIKAVTQLIEQKFNLLEQRIALEQQPQAQSSPLENPELLYQGEALMQEIRAVLDQFQASEKRLLQLRQESLRDVQNLITTTVWVLGGISLLSSTAAILLFNQVDWELEEQDLRLRQGRSLIQSVFANVVDGVLVIDEAENIQTTNAALLQMFGYERHEVLNQPLRLLVTKPSTESSVNRSSLDSNFVNSDVASSLDSLSSSSVMEQQQMLGYRRDGSPFPIEISISQIDSTNQRITIIRDITASQEAAAKLQTRADELIRLNLVLAKTNAELKNRNAELDQFSYVASHDLKAPLRAIASLSEWLEEDLADSLSEENHHQMRLLRGRVHRMEALINGLLQYSRVGYAELALEEVAVADLLEEIIDSLNPPPGFKIEFASDMPVFRTKRVLLQQVFANLITNAVRHHPKESGHVQISVVDEGDRYEFAVADDGAGIAEQYHDKIFTIFQTLEARDTVENTGVGLAIVRKIVEAEGGQISVSSQEGKGAVFAFTWPK